MGCSVVWGQAEDPQALLEKLGTLGALSPGPFLSICSGCHLWLSHSKRELSTLRLPWVSSYLESPRQVAGGGGGKRRGGDGPGQAEEALICFLLTPSSHLFHFPSGYSPSLTPYFPFAPPGTWGTLPSAGSLLHPTFSRNSAGFPAEDRGSSSFPGANRTFLPPKHTFVCISQCFPDKSPGGLGEKRPHTQSHSAGLGRGLGSCLPNQLPGDAAGPRATL